MHTYAILDHHRDYKPLFCLASEQKIQFRGFLFITYHTVEVVDI